MTGEQYVESNTSRRRKSANVELPILIQRLRRKLCQEQRLSIGEVRRLWRLTRDLLGHGGPC